MLIPYADFKYSDIHNMIINSVSNKTIYLDIYRMNYITSSLNNIDTYNNIIPLSEIFIDANVVNRDDRMWHMHISMIYIIQAFIEIPDSIFGVYVLFSDLLYLKTFALYHNNMMLLQNQFRHDINKDFFIFVP
jgi:hypothetical protein